MALRIFCTLPATVVERSFSKLNIIKNFTRSTMTQDRLNDLAVLSIESEVTRKIEFTDIIDMFAMKKGHFNYQTGRDSAKRRDFSFSKLIKPFLKVKFKRYVK